MADLSHPVGGQLLSYGLFLGDGWHFVKAKYEATQIEHGGARRLATVLARDGIFPSIGQFGGLDEPRFAEDAEVLRHIVL